MTEKAKQYGDNPAFPTEHLKLKGFTGITRREYFAAMAMQGLLSGSGIEYHENTADDAVCCADALLEELLKTE